ncbi:hypothetical protein JZ751_027567, partial [Albula glossodonta]
MLGTLCTLITLTSCVSGVTVVTQKPPVLTLSKGQMTAMDCVNGVTVVTQKPPVLTVSKGGTATLDCNLGTVTDSGARWYKQVPGGVPQYQLPVRCCLASPKETKSVSGQKVLTQKPSVLSLTKGQHASMDCNIVRDESRYVSWYKQVPGTAPQFVLRFYHSHSSPD